MQISKKIVTNDKFWGRIYSDYSNLWKFIFHKIV